MDDLRIALCLIGAMLVLVIYLMSRINRNGTSPTEHILPAPEREEPTFEFEIDTGHHWPAANTSAEYFDTVDDYDEVLDFDELIYEINQTGLFSDRHYGYAGMFNAANDDIKARPYISNKVIASPINSHEESVEPLLIVINVIARAGNCFDPQRLQAGMEVLGLQYGDRGVYHAYSGRHEEQPKPAGRLFSIASMAEQGCFNPSDKHSFRVPGLVFFLQLPSPMDGVLAFERMQQTAQALAEKVDGVVCDAAHHKLTKQTSNTIKDRISAFDVKLQTDYQPQLH